MSSDEARVARRLRFRAVDLVLMELPVTDNRTGGTDGMHRVPDTALKTHQGRSFIFLLIFSLFYASSCMCNTKIEKYSGALIFIWEIRIDLKISL